MKRSIVMCLLVLSLAITTTLTALAQRPPQLLPLNSDGSCPNNYSYSASTGMCVFGEIPIGNKTAPEPDDKHLFWILYDLFKFTPFG